MALQALAQHDGILGVTPLEAFPAPGQATDGVRGRLIVDGTPAETDAFIRDLQSRGFLSNRVEPALGASYVRAHFDVPGASTIVILRVTEPVPAVGQVVVVEGSAQTFLAPPGSSAALLWLDAREVGSPILFKNG